MIWDVRIRYGYFVYESWAEALNTPGINYASLNNQFFIERTKFWLLEHHTVPFDGQPGLANPEEEYILNLENG
jgi:hypothetical protein